MTYAVSSGTLNPSIPYLRLQNPNTNLIFKKYSEPEQNQTLIIKEPEPYTNPKLWVNL